MNRFLEIGKKHGTDKVSLHNYHEIYPQYIEKYYNSNGGMVEVGLLGGASLNLWLELFPNMHIYALDINPSENIQKHKRHTIIKTDQSIQTDLDNAFDKIEETIWFINDDGSHIPEHQLLTFNTLFPKLENGGVYIIEDCAGSYLKAYNGDPNLSPKKNLISYFQQKVHSTNSSYLQKKFERNVLDISLITFAREAIAIKKKVSKNKFKYQKKAFLNLNKLEKRKDKFGSLNLKKDQ